MATPWQTQDGRADMTNFEMDLFDTRMNSYPVEKEDSEQCCQHSVIRPACVPISIISLFILMIVFFPFINDDGLDPAATRYERAGICPDSNCRLRIVESIPTNMSFANSTLNPSTFETWRRLLNSAQKSIDVVALYWNLRDSTSYPTSEQGRKIFDWFVAASQRGVKIRVAQNKPSAQFPQSDSEELAKKGYASVRSVDVERLLHSGVLHTKLWIVDGRNVYLGSANMDWKSLTEVKELGYELRDCPCVAYDLSKIFAVYWQLGEDDSKIPSRWPLSLRTLFNFSNPLRVSINSEPASVFISSSPSPFNTKGREHDANAIVEQIDAARRFVHVSVMDYLPATLYMKAGNNSYWSTLDDALRSAAYRGVAVKLLISHWDHSRPSIVAYLKSLTAINEGLPRRRGIAGSIEVKLFTVPSSAAQKEIPFARVNHNKYMVTDRCAYVGTSNWVGDYFLTTAGVGISLSSAQVIDSLNAVFLRDWSSSYAKPL